MKNMVKTSFLFILLTIALECNAQERSEDWDRENVVKVKKTDSIYINAAKLAQENLPRFIELLNNREKNNYNFNIRASYTEDGHTEQLWFTVSKVVGNSFYATLNNVPRRIKIIKLGSNVIIQKENVKDWIISKDHKVLQGNFVKADL